MTMTMGDPSTSSLPQSTINNGAASNLCDPYYPSVDSSNPTRSKGGGDGIGSSRSTKSGKSTRSKALFFFLSFLLTFSILVNFYMTKSMLSSTDESELVHLKHFGAELDHVADGIIVGGPRSPVASGSLGSSGSSGALSELQSFDNTAKATNSAHPMNEVHAGNTRITPERLSKAAFHPEHFDQHALTRDCERDATDLILDEWKNNSRVVCSLVNGTFITEYILKSWQYQPSIVRFQNVQASSWDGSILPTGCPNSTVIQHEQGGRIRMVKPSWAKSLPNPATTQAQEAGEAVKVVDVKDTVLKINLFDTNNAYERFHAYLNTAMIMHMFDIHNPRLLLVLNHGDINDGDLEMWTSFSNLEPIAIDESFRSSRKIKGARGVKEYLHATEGRMLRFHDLIHISSSGTSIIVTESKAFQGRGRDHHCKSSLFRDIIHWMAMNFNIDTNGINNDLPNDQELQYHGTTKDQGGPSHNAHTMHTMHITPNPSNITRVTWSSRAPYCCREGKMYYPKRSINDESTLLQNIANELGPEYSINSVDFGKLTTRQSIYVAAHTDILVGVHGAGLMWSAFLPHHGGLVEIFGGDRGRGNRHYHNIASLADLHYREILVGNLGGLGGDEGFAEEVAEAVRGIEHGDMEVEPKL